MGLCNSKKQKSATGYSGGVVNSNKEITNIDDVQINKGDFIISQSGNFRDVYQIGNLLGQGAFGEVRKCINRKTKVIRAVKLVRKESMNREELQSFQEEIAILKQLDHPNILKLYEVFQDDKRFYLVTELCKGGELFDEIIKNGVFTEKAAAEVAQ